MYSSQIARIICRDAVEYSVEKYHNKIASKCRLFTSEQEGYVPITKFFGKLVSVKEILEKFEQHGCEDDLFWFLGDAPSALDVHHCSRRMRMERRSYRSGLRP